MTEASTGKEVETSHAYWCAKCAGETKTYEVYGVRDGVRNEVEVRCVCLACGFKWRVQQ